jgi:hypothetical protein
MRGIDCLGLALGSLVVSPTQHIFLPHSNAAQAKTQAQVQAMLVTLLLAWSCSTNKTTCQPYQTAAQPHKGNESRTSTGPWISAARGPSCPA